MSRFVVLSVLFLIGCRERGTYEDYVENTADYGLAADVTPLLEGGGVLTIDGKTADSPMQFRTGDVVSIAGDLGKEAATARFVMLKILAVTEGAKHETGDPIVSEAASMRLTVDKKGHFEQSVTLKMQGPAGYAIQVIALGGGRHDVLASAAISIAE
ncbi:MAG: hypothetical protein NXI04_28780 [Planctomycetaceae bacterium]|nr:hypothetical protein [Planctomycetaceae bacterium]